MMIFKRRRVFRKYREFILYGIFGFFTTFLNIGIYWFCYEKLCFANIPADAVAWVASVLFAFFTNKKWVFESKDNSAETIVHEIVAFFGCRIFTGLVDMLIMYMAVDIMGWYPTVWKIISNVIVIILNYLASRLIVFKKSSKTG